jgi:copper chaperone CopZ
MNTETRLSVPTMKCAGCVSAIEKALNDSGVAKAKADLESKIVLVETDIPLSALISTIKTAGFDAVEVS